MSHVISRSVSLRHPAHQFFTPAIPIAGRSTMPSLDKKQPTWPARVPPLQLVHHKRVQPKIVCDHKLAGETGGSSGVKTPYSRPGEPRRSHFAQRAVDTKIFQTYFAISHVLLRLTPSILAAHFQR